MGLLSDEAEAKKRSLASENVIVEEMVGRDSPNSDEILDKTHRKLKVCLIGSFRV